MFLTFNILNANKTMYKEKLRVRLRRHQS